VNVSTSTGPPEGQKAVKRLCVWHSQQDWNGRCDVIVVCLSAYFVNGSVFLHMLKSYTVKLVFICSINGSMFLHMLKAYAVKLVFICSIYCCAFISEIISSQHTQQIAACRVPMRRL